MSENLSPDLSFIDEKDIHRELLQLILNQSTSQLDTRLKQLDNPIKYLTLMKNHEQHQISLLMLAAFLGYDDIIRLLLSHDSTPDHVELKGRVIVSDELTINGATALYCACYQGQFTVAKTLIEFGHANVNQDTRDYRFHPLFLHAAMMNRRDVIDFLLDDKYANVNETKTFDEYQDPALGIAASEGHTSLVEYLIAKGADVNYYYEVKSEMRSWAIASAVFKGHLDIVRLLYHAGAHRALKNKHDSALLLNTAVKQMQLAIIDFLLDESICTIEDLELIACWSVSSDFSMNARSHMLSIQKIAIEQRLRLNIPKVPVEAIAIYDYQRECQTIEELDTIKDDPHRIFLEILLILERIAPSRPWRSIVEPLEAYDTTLVEHEQYEKALNILIHRFSLHQRLNLRFNFASFVWFFSRMLAKNGTIPVVGFLRVARLVFESCYLKEKHFKTLNTMYLIVIATKVLEQEGLSQSDQAAIYSWVRDVCRLRLTTSDGRTLLHICVDMKTNQTIEVRPWDIRRYIRYVWIIFMFKKEFLDGSI